MGEILCENKIRVKVTVMFVIQRVGQILHILCSSPTLCVWVSCRNIMTSQHSESSVECLFNSQRHD